MVAAKLPLDQPWTILAIGTSCVGVDGGVNRDACMSADWVLFFACSLGAGAAARPGVYERRRAAGCGVIKPSSPQSSSSRIRSVEAGA